MYWVLRSLVMPMVRVLQVMLRVMSLVRQVWVVHRVLVLLVIPTVWVPQVMLWWMASLAML